MSASNSHILIQDGIHQRLRGASPWRHANLHQDRTIDLNFVSPDGNADLRQDTRPSAPALHLAWWCADRCLRSRFKSSSSNSFLVPQVTLPLSRSISWSKTNHQLYEVPLRGGMQIFIRPRPSTSTLHLRDGMPDLRQDIRPSHTSSPSAGGVQIFVSAAECKSHRSNSFFRSTKLPPPPRRSIS